MLNPPSFKKAPRLHGHSCTCHAGIVALYGEADVNVNVVSSFGPLKGYVAELQPGE